MKMAPWYIYWANKTPTDNAWHPLPGANPWSPTLPSLLHRLDPEALAVDAAPLIAGAGSFAHFRQLPSLGWTAQANIFKNPRTMGAMHLTSTVCLVAIAGCQLAGVEYRNFIPRWASDRERRREEEVVRQQVRVGMGVGLVASWPLGRWRPLGARVSPLGCLMLGALLDLAHREYNKAHGF